MISNNSRALKIELIGVKRKGIIKKINSFRNLKTNLINYEDKIQIEETDIKQQPVSFDEIYQEEDSSKNSEGSPSGFNSMTTREFNMQKTSKMPFSAVA